MVKRPELDDRQPGPRSILDLNRSGGTTFACEVVARAHARLDDRPAPVAVRQALDLLGSVSSAPSRASGSRTPSGSCAAHARKSDRWRQATSSGCGRRPASATRRCSLSSPYAGLRPGEALALQWQDIREKTILVERALSLGDEADTKTTAHRTVRLLAPLRADLAACVRPAAGERARVPQPSRRCVERGGISVMA